MNKIWPDDFVFLNEIDNLWYWIDETWCQSEQGCSSKQEALDKLLKYADYLNDTSN